MTVKPTPAAAPPLVAPAAVEVTTHYQVSTQDGTLYTDSFTLALRRAKKHGVGVVRLDETRTLLTLTQVKNLTHLWPAMPALTSYEEL